MLEEAVVPLLSSLMVSISPRLDTPCLVLTHTLDFKAEALKALLAELSANDFDPYMTSVGGSGLGILSPYQEHRNKQPTDGLDDTIQGAFKVRKTVDLTRWRMILEGGCMCSIV